MQLHLVDATYELFRAHYAPRPPVLGRDGIVLSGVSGLVEQLLYLLREEGATHVGCATDRVIESFRNDLFPGYKSSFGMPADLLDQFPIAEAAVEALGIVLWPMVEFEADDAIAAAATRWADDEAVDKIVICTPDKDMAQLVRDERIVLWDRRRQIVYDEPGVLTKWGVKPRLDPRLAGARRGQLGWLPGPARLGREVGSGRPPTVRAPRDDPAARERVGRAESPGSGDPRRDPHASSGTPPSSTGRSRCSEPPTTVSTFPSSNPTSCAGTAHRRSAGRRSATNGGCRVSATAPTAGSTRAPSAATLERIRSSSPDA